MKGEGRRVRGKGEGGEPGARRGVPAPPWTNARFDYSPDSTQDLEGRAQPAPPPLAGVTAALWTNARLDYRPDSEQHATHYGLNPEPCTPRPTRTQAQDILRLPLSRSATG